MSKWLLQQSGSIEEVEEVKMDGRQRINALTSLGKSDVSHPHNSNTIRVDPLNDFKKYRAGFNITNKHYWSVTQMLFIFATLLDTSIVSFSVYQKLYIRDEIPNSVSKESRKTVIPSVLQILKALLRQSDVYDNASSGDTSEDFMFDDMMDFGATLPGIN
ncbi:transmembrane protein [Senna tora]|uniref:Transmembrane protein n=1 Tax=Senna tora TaxID=362788 RepID=A0A834XI79_9FABA|nr:transmembrane protein [Senna tora]